MKNTVLGYIKSQPAVKLLEVVLTGHHYKFRLVTPAGFKTLVVSVSPSDRRAGLNNRALIRRWARGQS